MAVSIPGDPLTCLYIFLNVWVLTEWFFVQIAIGTTRLEKLAELSGGGREIVFVMQGGGFMCLHVAESSLRKLLSFLITSSNKTVYLTLPPNVDLL